MQEIISFIKINRKRNRAIPETTINDLSAWRKIFGMKQNPKWRCLRKIILKNWTYPGVKAVISEKGKVVGLMIFLELVPGRRAIENIFKCKDISVAVAKGGKLLKIT